MSMSQFFTKENGNRLEELKLENLDGTPSDYHLLIRGSQSDAFKTAKMKASRLLAIAESSKDKLTEDGRAELLVHCETMCVASLIGGWNFDEAYTPELALDFLKNAPQLEQQINTLAVRKGGGVDAKKNKPSTTGQKKKSNSTKLPKVKKQV